MIGEVKPLPDWRPPDDATDADRGSDGDSVLTGTGELLSAAAARRTLGVSRQATAEEIKAAFFALAWKLHPDQAQHLLEAGEEAGGNNDPGLPISSAGAKALHQTCDNFEQLRCAFEVLTTEAKIRAVKRLNEVLKTIAGTVNERATLAIVSFPEECKDTTWRRLTTRPTRGQGMQ